MRSDNCEDWKQICPIIFMQPITNCADNMQPFDQKLSKLMMHLLLILCQDKWHSCLNFCDNTTKLTIYEDIYVDTFGDIYWFFYNTTKLVTKMKNVIISNESLNVSMIICSLTGWTSQHHHLNGWVHKIILTQQQKNQLVDRPDLCKTFLIIILVMILVFGVQYIGILL